MAHNKYLGVELKMKQPRSIKKARKWIDRAIPHMVNRVPKRQLKVLQAAALILAVAEKYGIYTAKLR